MGFTKSIERLCSRLKQHIFIRKLLTKYGQQGIIEQYKNYAYQTESIGTNSPIWVCWWQGEEHMPEVVTACYHSILKHACGHPVRLITNANQKEYLRLPDYIWQKYHEGKISHTHMSDIARMFLLKEYGGIWVDATNFLTKDIDDFVDTKLAFWSCRHITSYNNVSKGLWTSYFVASSKGHLIPVYLYDSWLHYWRENEQLCKYLLTDFFFAVGYEGIPMMKKEVDSVPPSPIGNLRKVLCQKFNPKVWEHHLQQSGFHKLSYKKYTDKLTKKNEKTHYAYLLEKNKSTYCDV